MTVRMRCLTSLAALSTFVWMAPMAQAQAKALFDLPAQPLGDSLRAVGSQTNTNLLFDPPLVAGKRAPELKGEATADEALTRLLAGTGIRHEHLNETTIVLAAEAARGGSNTGRASSSVGSSASQAGAETTGAASKTKEGKRDSSGPFRVAQGGPANAGSVSEGKPGPDGSIVTLQEVVVTAQKRTERLQDVPVPVTAVSADSLVQSNQLRLQDYYTRVPGLSISPGIQGTQTISIRGITTGSGNPTVGVVIDDVPYGGSTGLGSGGAVPDLDPSDLARIEILRGPQGTLYGASSMGGLVKFVTADPSTDRVSGRFQASTLHIANAANLGFSARGAVNVPLSSDLAMRASVFARRDPGYIDDPGLGLEGVNRTDTEGGHLSVLYKFADAWSAKLSALLQRTSTDASSDIFPSLGDLKQHYALPGLGRLDVKNQAYSAAINGDWSGVSLTSLTGFNINDLNDSLDYTAVLGALTPGQFGPGVTANPYHEHQRTRKVSEELRLSTALGSHVDWLLGGFFTHESNSRDQRIYAANPLTQVTVGEWLDNSFPTTYQELAAFTNFTLKLTDQFDVQIGARESHNKQSYYSIRTGPFVPVVQHGTSPAIIPERDSDANAFTYLLTPQYKLSPDFMAYVRLASGYRAGGPNSAASAAAGVPPQFNPDKTYTYEFGVKGDVLAHALTFDASAYYIDWKDIQLGLTSSIGSYTDNAGRAKSQGVELSIEARPATGLTISAWGSYNDAVLKDPFPSRSSAYAVAGARLPFTSRFSASLSVDEKFALSGTWDGFVGATVSYVGDRLSIFRGLSAGVPLPRQDYPAYAKTDLRAGVSEASWTLNVFANNVTDRRGALAGGLGAFVPAAFNYIQPRTVGLSVSRDF